MQGPKIPWRPGRIDGFAAQVTPDGRLPDASQGSDHLRNVRLFYSVVLLFVSLPAYHRSSTAWGTFSIPLPVVHQD